MLQPLVTEQVPEPENEENEWSTQYRKWDFALPVLVPVLRLGECVGGTGGHGKNDGLQFP